MGGDLFERAVPLGALRETVERAASGSSGAVALVSGESGVGKTTLIGAFLRELAARGADGPRVLTGACDDLLAPRGLGPLRDAMAGTGGPLEAALDGDAPATEIPAAAAREFAGPRLDVLVVEDAHWADDATLDVLSYLARRLATLRLVVVLTFRDEALDDAHPMRELLGVLAGAPVRRVRLEPLSEAAVAGLSAGTRWDAAALHALTGGNPFYVTEVLAAPGQEVPATVTDAVLARLRRLDRRCRTALEQLSVVPTRVGFPLAEALLGDLEVLDEAERRGVLEARAGGLAFRHELARRAIERGLPAVRRLTLNRAVLRALREQDPPDLARLVHHAVEAHDPEAVARYAPEAGRQAARAGSRRQAIAHYEAALRHAHLLPRAERARLTEDHAWELYNTHRYPEAVRAGREAVALYEELDDPVALGEALVRLSRHVYMTGRTDQAEEAVDRAVRVLEPTGSASALAHASVYRGAMYALTERSEAALTVLRQARRLAVRAGRQDLVALCSNYLGMAGADVYGASRGIRLLRASLAQARACGHHEYTARGYTNLSELLYRYGRYDELDECVAEGLAFVRERGMPSHAYNLETHRCLSLTRKGRWAEAEEGLRALVEESRDPGMLYVYSVPPYARLLARRGDERAASLLAQAWERARRQRSLLGIAYAGIAYVEWAWLNGRPELAAEVGAVVARRTERPGEAPLRGELLRYLRRAGLEARPFAGCPEEYAAGLRGDWQAAVAAWERIGDPYERALELAESGRAAGRQAVRELERLGAVAAAGVVRARWGDAAPGGTAPGARAAAGANPAGLTARQAHVLALMAEGLTNAEIAERLALSVRTVDHHVSAVLGKLGARTRREAADAARSRGYLTAAG
ncbi:ATP-binding protein [Actinomadura namibiensis]|uniref:DNA-binding CsgD family transcriptional regulator/tetratricopeptide (TPR) repeat protein/GTPase SAR1 family protein n=1 Tax=Actinomadura namibiensis TaxID=182080 RepID=A0A7W3LX84_ACTNM|nr:LuxR family transcriptional regulator [Actinomadura namibiensis]MBA8955996.1 DNA-binding CsgD family transcriptional regulator/tetratricopeptide (TPR) repeat protein/GTPase SAR1 family protein [Actinomadura namibiensis]